MTYVYQSVLFSGQRFHGSSQQKNEAMPVHEQVLIMARTQSATRCAFSFVLYNRILYEYGVMRGFTESSADSRKPFTHVRF